MTPLLGARGGSSREPTARAYGTSGDGPRRHPAGRGTCRVSPHSACGGVDRRGEQAATRRVANVASHLQDVEDNLPLESALRGRRLAAVNPPIVVDAILQTGLTGAGVATAGYGLPNDLEVQREAGTRTATFRNVLEAPLPLDIRADRSGCARRKRPHGPSLRRCHGSITRTVPDSVIQIVR